jgi:hypothetical protein
MTVSLTDVFDFSVKTALRGDRAEIRLHVATGKTMLRPGRFLGCAGWSLSISATDFVFEEWTPDKTVNVRNKMSSESEREAAISPNVKIESEAGASAEVSAVTATFGDKDSQEVMFDSQEAILKALMSAYRERMTWDLTMPRGKKVIRDFLQENVELFALAHCLSSPITCRIEGYPTAAVFLDSRYAELGPLQRLALRIVCMRQGLPRLERHKVTHYRFFTPSLDQRTGGDHVA